MNQDYLPTTPLTPPEQPQKKNNTLIIVVVVIGVILLCCCGVVAGLWLLGDQIVQWLGFNVPQSLLQTILLM